jgi:hypothetical protein
MGNRVGSRRQPWARRKYQIQRARERCRGSMSGVIRSSKDAWRRRRAQKAEFELKSERVKEQLKSERVKEQLCEFPHLFTDLQKCVLFIGTHRSWPTPHTTPSSSPPKTPIPHIRIM